MKNQISPERKTAYYAAMVISGVGILLFLSVFVTGALNFGNFENFEGQARSSMFLAIGGMVGDALDASNLSKHLGNKGERVVMIKCSACGKLNEEDSKFCQECGNSFAD